MASLAQHASGANDRLGETRVRPLLLVSSRMASALLALIVTLLAAVLMVRTATSAGLSVAQVAGLRGALSFDGVALVGHQAVAVHSDTVAHTIPAHPVRTILVMVHIIGLTLGMGAALFLDLFLLTRLYVRRIDHQTTDLLDFGARLVTAGLALLWASGLGLLAFYYFAAPFALENPKLIAKVAAVSALTLNGVLLHNLVLPMVKHRLGKPLLAGLPLSGALMPISIGVASGVSWAFCCVLGMVKELNGVVPAPALLAAYLAALALGIAVACTIHVLLETRSRFVPAL